MKYRAEIDGLRALAVLPVILFHAGFEWFRGGFVGVDVFFVISGYLITTIIISEMAEGKFSVVNFYERRARRILPALFFVMAVSLPFAWLWLTPSDLKDFGQSLVAVSTFSSNILFWWESGYFDTAAELKPLLHTWSLAVEEQYYILFPIFLLLTWRFGIKCILILLSLVFVLSLGLAHWGAFYQPSSTFYLFPTRGWELLAGVFAAFFLKYNTYLKSHFLNQILSLLGLGLVVYSIIAFDETTPFPSLYALVPTVGTGLLILSAVPNTFVYKLLSLKSLVGIGLISYSAYLWHQPMLALARHRLLGEVSDFLLISLCGLSILIAWFSWRYVERPFRNKSQLSRRFIFHFSIISVAIFSGIGVYIHKYIKPTEFINFPNLVIEKPAEYPGIYYEGKECSFPALEDQQDFCLIPGGDAGGEEFILIGDSHARVLSGAFYENKDNYHSLIDLTSSGCPFLLDINIFIGRALACSDGYQAAREEVLKDHPNSIVIYHARLPFYFYGTGFDNGRAGGGELKPPIIASAAIDDDLQLRRDLFLASLEKSLSLIAAHNKTLYVILPTFTNGWDPINKLEQLSTVGYSFEEALDFLFIPNEVIGERLSTIRSAIEDTARRHENVTTIDPNDIICVEGGCIPLSKDGDFFFTDEDHLSTTVNLSIYNAITTHLKNLD